MFERPREILAGCMALLLVACAPQHTISGGDEDGIGGTGVVASTDGIGGTGLRASEEPDGIGGTGLWSSQFSSGDIGFYGVVTALNTLTVNGHSLNVSDQTTVSLNGESSNPSALELGQVVSVHAGLVDGAATAIAIHVHQAVIGPVQRIADNGDWVEILGQRIAIGESTRFNFAGDSKPNKLKINQVLKVSGLRHVDGAIDASLIQLAASRTQFRIEGWARKSIDGRLQIGQHKFSYPTANNSTEPNIHIQLNGEIGEDGVIVSRASAVPALAFRDQVDVWIVQAYALASATTGGVEFSSLPGIATGPVTNKITSATEQRVIATIRFDATAKPVFERIAPAPPTIEGSRFVVPHYSSGGVPSKFDLGKEFMHSPNARETIFDVSKPPTARGRAEKLPRPDEQIAIPRGGKSIGRGVDNPRAPHVRPDVRPTVPVRPPRPLRPRVDVIRPGRTVLDIPAGGATVTP
jgi:hypothetical protein